MRVVVYCTGRSDPFVLKKFAEFAGFVGKRGISIKAAMKGNVFGVDDVLKRLPEIAQALCGEFEKLIVVLDGSELRKSKKHKSRGERIARAADAVPQGMTICIVYMNQYLEQVHKDCLPPKLHKEYDRESNKVRKSERFAKDMTKELAEKNTSYQDFAAALRCECRQPLTKESARAGKVFPEAS